MLQTYSEKLTLVYHNSGINTFVGVPILQTYSKKLTFVYHNSGINTFVGVPILQTYSEKFASFDHISASTLLGGCQCCKLTARNSL
jgi:hypothetical protein